jgi:hypothetical protein
VAWKQRGQPEKIRAQRNAHDLSWLFVATSGTNVASSSEKIGDTIGVHGQKQGKRCTKPIWQAGIDSAHKGACASSTQLSSGRS